MWNQISGKSINAKDEESSTNNRRNGDEPRSTRLRSSSAIVSSDLDKKASPRGDDRDRGFKPTSTSYSTTSRSPYPGTASASVASSYATATGRNDDEQYVPPILDRNASLADQMPKLKSSRSERDVDGDQDYRSEWRKEDKKDNQRKSRDRGDQRQGEKNKRDRNDKDHAKDRGLSRSGNGLDEGGETSRGPADFPDQVGSAGFSQFPGQYDGGIPGAEAGTMPGATNGTQHQAMSSHVQDQFPGQFPIQSAAPYRPPLAASEGGPGLAAEYYGDAGESVAEQPGFRKHSPSLIIGAEPHLLPASAVANPPPEPSASGGVGAAASFFSGSFDESEAESGHAQQGSSTYTTAQSRPDNTHHLASAPAIPTIVGAATGAATGYFMVSQGSSHQSRPDQTPMVGLQSEYSTTSFQQPPSQVQGSLYSEETRPSKPGKSSSHRPNIPLYAAGATGAAGLAAAAYHEAHDSSPQHNSPMSPYPTTPMAQQHRHHGPFNALVDFFRDPEGVAQFEEYSEIIGVCKYCFAPSSSPRDAPRKHYYHRRRSNERLGNSTRIDKDNRYYSSENERQRRKDKSWLASGVAGYGLGKMGETLFKQKNDFDDTYSVKTGRRSPEGRSHKPQRRSRSQERVETGITSDGRIYRKDTHGGVFGAPSTTTYSSRQRSRSRSRDRKNTLTEAALGATVGATIAGSSSGRRSHSPKGAWVKNIRKAKERSPERRRKSHKRKKEKGFFSFIDGSSSSSSLDLAYTSSQEKRSHSKSSKSKSSDDKKAEAALLGLGAAAAALALKDGRQGREKKGVKELVGVKETREKHDHGSKHDRRARVSFASEEDEAWESAPEDDQESVNSDLAYGTHTRARRGSRESLSCESFGTDKWGWRWGSKKTRRQSPPNRKSSDHGRVPVMAGAAAAGLAGAAMMSPDQHMGSAMDSTSSLPLQHVYPIPTSDPSRFDVGREGSVGSSGCPGIVPIQQPQPVTPISSAIYSNQAPYEHSYSAPTGPPVFSQPPFQSRPPVVSTRSKLPDFNTLGDFPQEGPQPKDDTRDFKIMRRGTSPARVNADSIASEMTPTRRPSAKDDISAVRFDLTEEQEERDRWERHQTRKEDRQRQEAKEQEQIDRDRRAAMETQRKVDPQTSRQESPERSFAKSGVAPAAAAGVVGAAIGAAVAEGPEAKETREERKERRRREREREQAEEEEADKRRERRRRTREQYGQRSTTRQSRRTPDDAEEVGEDVDREGRYSTTQELVRQEAASPRRSSTYEDYGAFFAPSELIDRSNNKVEITSANADADVDLDRIPRVVTVEPKREHEPVFSPADTDDRIDPSKLFLPWQVPSLILVEPTPPSSRGATPILRPKDTSDEDVEKPPTIEDLPNTEEPPKKASTSRVTWGDDQTLEYTVITPYDERKEFLDSASKEVRDVHQGDESIPQDEAETPSDRRPSARGTASGSNTTSFGDDIGFAATLAASAEDAGFDPSIVINDPKYRRRESPPGSNERSMPGGFEDDEETPLNRKEPKRMKPNGRDDDAIVQDILSQVEYVEPEEGELYPVDETEKRENSRKSKSKKSRKSSKDSESRDEFFKTPESTERSRDTNGREFYESPTEDAQSSMSSISGSRDGENSRKSRRRSKRNSTKFDNAASAVSSPSAVEASNDAGSETREKSKGSLWSRVLGKPAHSTPQKNGVKDAPADVNNESKPLKEHRSTRDEIDYYDATGRSSATSERSRRRRNSESSTARSSGRITQDLPAKVYTLASSGRTMKEEMLIEPKDLDTSPSTKIPDAGSVAQYLELDHELEQGDAQVSEYFLGMRPEPPPPPNIPDEEKEPPDPSAVSLLASPPSLPGDRAQQASVPVPPSPLQYPAALPSPPAVPVHFRWPRHFGARRSLSQAPLASTQNAPDGSPRHKPRPRSTESRGSKDMTPLPLVERHDSHQEQALDETYPPLPSSLSTSRASSVHDPEEYDRIEVGGSEMTEEGRGLTIDTGSKAMQSDLLDSQQATPTATSFEKTQADHHSSINRNVSQDSPMQGQSRQFSSTLRDAPLGAMISGSTTYPLSKASHNDNLSEQGLLKDDNEQLQQGLDDMAPAPGPRGSHLEENQTIQNCIGSQGHAQHDFNDSAPDVDANEHHDDFAHQSTEITKSKREASEPEEAEDPDPVTSLGAASSRKSTEPQSADTGEARQLEEPKKIKYEAVFDEARDTSELTEATELPDYNLEPTKPTVSQKGDGLTKEMCRDQVADIMTITAQIEHTDPAPSETLLERRQSKSKGKKGKKGKKNLVLADDGLPSSTKDIGFVDPFAEQFRENVSQSPQNEVAAEEGHEPTFDKEPMAKSPTLDVYPEATPLPVDDDLDLLDELPASPTSQQGNYEFDPEADNVRPVDKSAQGEEYLFPRIVLGTSSDVQNVQNTADKPFPSLSEEGETISTDPTPIAKTQDETQFLAAVLIENLDLVEQVHNLEVMKVVGAPVEEKSKQTHIRDQKLVAEAELTQIPATTHEELEDESAKIPDSNTVVDIPPQKAEAVNDDWPSFSKKKSEKDKQQKSKATHPESGEPIEPQPSTQDMSNEPAPTAATTTAQDVREILDKEEVIGPVHPAADKPFLSTDEAPQEIQEPGEVRSLGREDLALPEEKMATGQGSRLKTHEPSDIMQSEVGEKSLPPLDSSSAAVDTAKGVQEILDREDITPPTPSRQGEAEVLSAAIEDTANSQLKEVQELGWNAPDKNRKAKKSEGFASDEPEPESALSFTPPVEVEPQLGSELTTGAVEQFLRKKSRKDKKGKKQSLSRPANDNQDKLDPKGTSIDTSQDNEENAKLLDAPFPISARDTLREKSLEPTEPTESTPPAGSKDISEVELPQKQEFAQARIKKEKRKSKKSKAFVWDEDAAHTPEKDSGSETKPLNEDPATTTANIARDEALEIAEPTEPSPPDASKEIFEADPSREEQTPVPKSKKDKKSKKSRPFSWEDDAALKPEDETILEVKDLVENTPANPADTTHTERSASIEGPGFTPLDAIKEISEVELPRELDRAPPKNKKDRKSKKTKSFSWDDEVTSTPVDEAGIGDKGLTEDALEQATLLDDAVTDQAKVAEPRSKSKKDRKKAKKAQALSLNGEEELPLDKETVRDPDKDTEGIPTEKAIPSVPITPQESVASVPKSEIPMQQPIQPMSSDISFGTAQTESSAPACAGQSPKASNDLEGNVDDGAYPTSKLEQSEKDKEKGEEARTPSWDEELRPEPKRTSEESAAKEDLDAPTITQLSEAPGEWSKQERLTEKTEPTQVIEPDDTLSKNRDPQESTRELDSSDKMSNMKGVDEAEAAEGFPIVNKSKGGKKFKQSKLQTSELEEDQSLLEAEASLHLSAPELEQEDAILLEDQPREALGAFEELQSTQDLSTTAIARAAEQKNASYTPATADISDARTADEPWEVPVKKGTKSRRQLNGAQITQDESETVEDAPLAAAELSLDPDEAGPQQRSVTGVDNTLVTVTAHPSIEIERPKPQEPPHNTNEDLEVEQQGTEPSLSQEKDAPDPVDEVEMMYAEDDINSDNERSYARNTQGSKRSQSAVEGLPSPVAEVEMLYARDEADFLNDEAAEQAMQRQQSPAREIKTTAADAELLDPREVVGYNDEYAEKRERQEIEHLQNLTDDLPTPATEDERIAYQEPQDHIEKYMHEHQRQENESSQTPTIDFPISIAEAEIICTDKPCQRDEELSGKHERQDKERTQSPSLDLPTDLPTPVAEVQMLNPQEQRVYEEEYAKELQRQLSPMQDEELSQAPSGEVSAQLMPQPSFGTVMEQPYEDIHRPLAQPPSLEDIVEEPRSGSGSVQESPIPSARGNELSFRPTKKSKKGKKGKKQEQPIIWEDETATPPIKDEIEQLIEPSMRSPDLPGSYKAKELQRPIDLEEPIERRPIAKLTEADYFSPTRDLSSSRDSPKEYGKVDDYFSIQPTKGAEEDVEAEQTVEHEDPMSRELPQAIREEQLAGEPPLAKAEQVSYKHRHRSEDDVLELERSGLDDQSRLASTSVEARAEDDSNFAHSRSSSKKVNKLKRSLGLLRADAEHESSPSSQPLDEPVERSTHPDVSILNSFSEMPEPSRQRHSRYEANPTFTNNERPMSESTSRSTERLAADATAGLGLGAIAAQGLSRRKPRKEGKRNKRRSRWDDLNEETRDSESPTSRVESLMENRETGSPTEQGSSILIQQELLHAPPPTTYGNITSEPDIRDTAQTIESSNIRDSGYVADSPIVSDEVPVHRAVRDSGYPQTEMSPIVDVESRYQNTRSTREIDDLSDSAPKPAPQEYDYKNKREEPRNLIPQEVSEIPVEASPISDALRAAPKVRRRRRKSGASYDSDDSNDSGFDIQRRRRMQAVKDEVREPSPVSSTTKERSSELFGSSPSARPEHTVEPREYHYISSHSDHIREEPTWSFNREVSPSPQAQSRDVSGEIESTHTSGQVTDSPAYKKLIGGLEEPPRSLFGGPVCHDEDTMSRSLSPPNSDGRGRGRLNTIDEEISPLHKKVEIAMSDVGSPEAGVKERRMRSPLADDTPRDFERSRSRNTDLSSRQSVVSHVSSVPRKHPDGEDRKSSIASNSSDKSIHAIIQTPDQVRSASGQSFRSSGTPPLRRVDRSVSGDLRGASKLSEAKIRANISEEEAELDINIPSSSTYDPITDKGKSRANMADVYEGWGDVRGGSPMSPTRPPSMRKRQSMQLLEYETRLDQLVSENRVLQSQKATAERSLEDQACDHSQQRLAYEEAIQEHKVFLAQKDSELNELKGILEEWQSKVTHLTEVNEALCSREADEEHEERYRQLEAEHTNLREQHTQLSTGMEGIVRHEVSVALEEKNLELRQLRDELENAKQQVRNLQQQLLASRSSEGFIERDEDYFDSQCQSLCQHAQQWVLRFSKFSDMKACYHPSEIRDEKIVDRMENAILDGTDVDEYLQDRVKRRDVFMSVVMTMIWEFIFTRYLFGMDREQRQKLKNLEKTLQEVGPISAVHKWRATTLTLLMKRPSFEIQRATDTEAVVQEIYDTLATFLPPPSHLVNQIQESLRKVINAAVDLSIEMRTQRAEYSMLPPLQPEYDTNGDLARNVYFSALTMNERSGQTSSNEALQGQRAVVRMVLFPLVVKNEDDDEQIVVCPAQVLVAEGSWRKGKSVRVMSAQGARSEASFAGTDVNTEVGMI